MAKFETIRISAFVRLLLVLALLFSGFGTSAAASEQQIENSFRKFAQEYMTGLRRENCRSEAVSPVQSYENGYFIRSVDYNGQWAVYLKKTDSKATPYIGMLTYQEKHLVRYAAEAKDLGPQSESVVSEVPVTEIFRYSAGSWQY
jgi:hypothetical protein